MANPIEDQWNAAAEDARRRLHIANPGGPVVAVDMRDEGENSPRAQLLGHCLGHFTDEDASAGCPHVNPDSPEVLFAAVAFPGKIFCGGCFQLAWKVYSAVWNKIGYFTPCDNCHGEPVPGNVSGSSTGVVNYGPIMVTISLCAKCTRTNSMEEGD